MSGKPPIRRLPGPARLPSADALASADRAAAHFLALVGSLPSRSPGGAAQTPVQRHVRAVVSLDTSVDSSSEPASQRPTLPDM